jgi:hypothetical protein
MYFTLEAAVFLIGITQSTTDDTIARIAAHLPVGASMGRILGASTHGILTEGGVCWTFDGATDSASRMLPIGSGAL